MPQDMQQEINRVAMQLQSLNTAVATESNLSDKKAAMVAIQRLAEETPREIFDAASKLVRNSARSTDSNIMVDPTRDPGNRSFVAPQNRAMGGEMMAQPQMDPEMARQAGVLEQAEMEARATGEQLGAEYAQKMMAGIDGAQSTEDLINALRGNDRPLDARRDELAGYVGQSDAEQTPESVLAMVQPVIMMTEEGIMDSGIGNLMQQITGEVDMMTESGQPTDMGQGVGSLMMAGAPEAPAPQNFRQGGAVQKFQTGGPALTFSADNVSTQYEALLPLFQQINSQAERDAEAAERAEMDKTQALLALTRGGLRLMAGDPEAGGSLVSQVGAAFEPTAAEIAALGAQAQERRSGLRAEDRALRSAALQGAIGVEQAAVSDRQARELARIQAGRQTYNFDTYVRPKTDNPATEEIESGLETIAVDPRNRKEIQDATDQGYKEISAYRAETGGDKTPKPMVIKNRDTGVVVANIDLSTEAGRARSDAMTPDEIMVSPRAEEAPERAVVVLDDGNEYPSTTGGRSYVEDGVTLQTPTDARVLKGNDLADHLQKKTRAEKYSTIYDATMADINENQNTVGLDPLTIIVNSSKKGVDIGKPMMVQGGTGVSQMGGNVVPAQLTDPEIAQIIQNLTPDVFQAALDGTGPIAAIQATFDRLFGAGPIDPSIFVGDTAGTQQARQNLRAAMILSRSALVDEDSNRYVVSENEAIGSLFADPDSFFQNPETQAAKLSQLKQAILGRYVALLQRGSVGELGSTASSREKREQKINQLATVLRLFQSVPIETPIDQERVDRNQQRLDNLLGIAD